jgi:hypothetical protein
MTHPLRLAALFAFLLTAACGAPKPDAVAEDLTRLCAGLTELEARHIEDGFEHSRAMQDVLSSAVRESATRDFMGSLATRGSSAERVAALKAFAAEHGLPNYECSVLER